jgi:hypothetical protein
VTNAERFPAGQIFIDRQKDRIAGDAAEHGWECISRDPLILSKGDKRIEVGFNSAGLPNNAKWLVGNEYNSMGATGYMDLNELYRWFTWEPKGE